MAKRKHNTRKRKHSNKKNSNRFLRTTAILILISLLTSIAAYFFILKSDNKDLENKNKQDIQSKTDKAPKDDNTFFVDDNKRNKIKENHEIDKFEEYTKDLEKEYLKHIEPFEQSVDKKTETAKKLETVESKKEDFKENIQEGLQKDFQDTSIKDTTNNKPKLAIVIDDVAHQVQVDRIKDIGYTINIAFMPPTSNHKYSAKIAQNEPHAIVHFPLQAGVSHFEEENTLKVGDSYEKIEQRVAKVRQWYPHVKYTNNHTGSVFTSDDKSMDMFIKALKKHNFQFIDSKTTAKSVAKKYTKKYEMHYITRNIFLDNKKDFNYIQNQLKKAIRIAKKTGSAIAIGHPYKITMKTLKESKPLLKDLDLVYIHQLPIK